MSRVPPDSFFAPVVRPWVDRPKPTSRRRIPTGEHVVFNPALPKESLPGQGELPAQQEKDLRKRFARVSVAPEAKRTARRAGPTGQRWEDIVEDTQKRIEREGDEGTSVWNETKSMSFVALYTVMHARVYGVEPTMTATDRTRAAAQV